jgi:acetyl-CoA carboxylase beta subunit
MYESVQNKLIQLSILDQNEPILSFIQVVDFVKQQQLLSKKALKEGISSLINAKHYYLLASRNSLKFHLDNKKQTNIKNKIKNNKIKQSKRPKTTPRRLSTFSSKTRRHKTTTLKSPTT